MFLPRGFFFVATRYRLWNRIGTIRSGIIGNLAGIAVAMATREAALTETSEQVKQLTKHMDTLRAGHDGDRARVESLRTAARDEALQALQGPATLAEVFPLLAIGMDRGSDVSGERLGAVVAEAERLVRVAPDQTVVRVAQDDHVTAYRTASGLRLTPDNSGLMIDVVRGDGNAIQLTGSLSSLVKRLPDGTYIPAHGMYAGAVRIREGFGRVVKTDPTGAVAWAAAIYELGNTLKWLGVSRDDINKARIAAMDAAGDVSATDRQAATRAILAVLCLDEHSRSHVADNLRDRLVSELRRALGGISEDAGVAKVQRAELRRSVEHRLKTMLDLAYKQDTPADMINPKVDQIFKEAESEG